MKKHKIKSVMVTSIYFERRFLVTKERMENYCKGGTILKDSVNGDLESLFKNIRLGIEPNERVEAYFLPKLAEEEVEFVERKDTSYLQTFRSIYPDVDETEMMLSKSYSKYVNNRSRRRTLVIENSSNKSLKNKCSLQ